MFEYVRLKNFKSFKDVELNLLDRRNKPKKLVLIYGENGIGKSNIASAFLLLSETLRTMDVRDLMTKLVENDFISEQNQEMLMRFVRKNYKDIERLIEEYKTVSSDEPMSVEFGFNIHGKKGKYLFQTDNKQIINERLEFTLAKRRGVYFNINQNVCDVNERIFLSKEAYNSVVENVHKFWGKHSFLSILLHESKDKSDQYINNQISDNFKMFLNFVTRISCNIKIGSREESGVLGLPPEMLGDYEKGTISVKEKDVLDKNEKMLTTFLRLSNRYIERAYYKKNIHDDKIDYQLTLTENIAGKLRDIDISLESTGTQSIIQKLPFMLVAVKGVVSVIDEFETGIHDLLVETLMKSLIKEINGQLILTTHNTLLMESNIPKESIYVINEKETGGKEIECILHYNNKIGDNNNIRNQYLLGKFKGIPAQVEYDFNQLLEIIEK